MKKCKKHALYSIPTKITKVQLIYLMSKVPNRFRHHNTLRERISHVDNGSVVDSDICS